MKTKVNRTTINLFVTVLLFMTFALSGCASKCPPDGKWLTSDQSGLGAFTTSSCKIQYVMFSIDISSLPNQFGKVFAQQVIEKSGKYTTLIIQPECTYENDGTFNCKKDQITFSGKFTSENQAEGKYSLPMGLQLNSGFSLSVLGLSGDWTATITSQ